MLVRVPTPLRSYTGGRPSVEGSGTTLRAVLASLERAHPGMRFRMVDEQDAIREHIRFFVGSEMARDLAHPVRAGDEVEIICALSGGRGRIPPRG